MARRTLGIALALAVLTAALYAPVRHFEFVPLDDPLYVTENTNVTSGLTLAGIAWALTAGRAANWHPVTWMSHMLDVELFGLSAGHHHLTNVAFHVVNTLLLFWVLVQLTGATFRAAFVAALFAVHPLHVESVAWIAERKDVLSTFFWLLTMAAYVWYVRSPRWPRFLWVIALYALGLMAKPMLVTLPLVLLLMDFWPLQRAGGPFRDRAWGGLVREKLPLFTLAAISSVITFMVQRQGGAMAGLESVPLTLRLENVPVAYVWYVVKTLWPAGLTVLYPHAPALPAGQVVAALFVLGLISVMAARYATRAPYVLAGWLWFLVTLLPVIGIVQVGVQSMADRYTYIPLIGLFIMAAWGIPAALERWQPARFVLPVAAGVLVLASAAETHAQLRYWKDGTALWGRAVQITFGMDETAAHNALGAILRDQGRTSEALANFAAAATATPESADAQNELAFALARQGKMDQALVHFFEVVRLRPDLAVAQDNLGAALASVGRTADALPHFAEAVRLAPNFELAHQHLGTILAGAGRATEAIREFNETLRINPQNDVAKRGLDALTKQSKTPARGGRS